MTDAKELWEQQPLETDTAFAAFATYRDAGHARTLNLTARACNTSTERIHVWHRKHSWRKRIEAWNRHMDRQNRVSRQKDLQEMSLAHLSISALLIKKGLERLNEVAPEELRPGEAAKFIQLGVDMEKAARGYAVEALSSADEVIADFEALKALDVDDDAVPQSFADALK